MEKKKILVVGSFVMDQIGKTDIFPKEGQTVFGKSFTKAPGGKGANQAVQMARLGAEVTMVGKVGNDSNGTEMLQTCREAGINVDNVIIDPVNASGCSLIILEEINGQTRNRIIVIPGANMTMTIDEVRFLENTIQNYDMVVLQLEIPMEVNEYVAKIAYQHGVEVMLNSAPSAPLSDDFISHLSYISPNEHEAFDLTGVKIENDDNHTNLDDVKKACKVLQDKGCKNVIITLGSGGSAIMLEDGSFYHKPCVKGIKAVDPTAAGDSFVGAFCSKCGLLTVEDSLTYANHVAALTVTGMGAMPSLPVESRVDAFLREKGVILK